jgi:4-hydroxythreonine-4-phosphate dehydrogenase
MLRTSRGQRWLALRVSGGGGSVDRGGGRRPVVAVTMGDPAGVGPELALAAASDPSIRELCKPVIVGGSSAMAYWEDVTGIALASGLRDPGVGAGAVEAGTPSLAGARAAVECVAEAARMCLSGEADAMVTAPVSKGGIAKAGYDFTGHTEFLAELTGADDYLMTFVHGEKRVALATTHLALADVPAALTERLLVGKLATLDRGLREWFEVDAPALAVAALNPHAGEGGNFGDEETRIIAPAIEEARRRGIDARGPFPADSVFLGHGDRGSGGPGAEFDAILAMYHDQGTIAAKMWGFHESVNVTLGLPIVRTSVDHGTAFAIAGKSLAKRGSMLAAVRLAAAIAGRRVNRLDGGTRGSIES